MTAPPAGPERRLRGVLLMMGAVLCFTGIDSAAKWLVLAGLPTGEVVFVRYLGHFLAVSALFLPRHGVGLFRSGDLRIELLRGALLLGGTTLNFIAVRHLPLTVTSAIFFTMPLMVCALSIPLLGERVGPRRWAAILVGFAGVLAVTRPWGAEAHWATLLSVGAALSASLYAIATRRLAGVDSVATQQLYAALLGAFGVAPLALAGWAWPVAAADWAAFLSIGLFGFLGHQLLTLAHAHAPASALAPFVYSQIVYMTLSSWLIFAEPPDLWTLVGAAIVIGAGLYIWLRERRLDETAPGRG